MSESDRYSLEALRNIHREMDDDKDGGIEVEESVEVWEVSPFSHIIFCLLWSVNTRTYTVYGRFQVH